MSRKHPSRTQPFCIRRLHVQGLVTPKNQPGAKERSKCGSNDIPIPRSLSSGTSTCPVRTVDLDFHRNEDAKLEKKLLLKEVAQ
ncbi:hypothetical protein NPIL_702291 [Nephila pilipes]|uniref:Uncharacterized protein n=1 Tax=Nephila pilipes TaxID=299642 RepID=A0A8X6N4P9_NEPPI|nr:hypothetical protein NPIL_702291 [Nephila pilipes]